MLELDSLELTAHTRVHRVVGDDIINAGFYFPGAFVTPGARSLFLNLCTADILGLLWGLSCALSDV